MNICLPVTEDKGLQSPLSAHFGSAPMFLIVNTDTGSAKTLPNRNLHHEHGMCQPLAALQGEVVDGIVVGGIGRGALGKLQAASIRVFLAQDATVEAALTAFKAGKLVEATPSTSCGGHHGQGPHGPHGHGDGHCGGSNREV